MAKKSCSVKFIVYENKPIKFIKFRGCSRDGKRIIKRVIQKMVKKWYLL